MMPRNRRKRRHNQTNKTISKPEQQMTIRKRKIRKGKSISNGRSNRRRSRMRMRDWQPSGSRRTSKRRRSKRGRRVRRMKRVRRWLLRS